MLCESSEGRAFQLELFSRRNIDGPATPGGSNGDFAVGFTAGNRRDENGDAFIQAGLDISVDAGKTDLGNLREIPSAEGDFRSNRSALWGETADERIGHGNRHKVVILENPGIRTLFKYFQPDFGGFVGLRQVQCRNLEHQRSDVFADDFCVFSADFDAADLIEVESDSRHFGADIGPDGSALVGVRVQLVVGNVNGRGLDRGYLLPLAGRKQQRGHQKGRQE